MTAPSRLSSLVTLGPYRWSALSVMRAVRGGIGVTLPLVVGWLTGHVDYGAYAALGALPAGFASFEGESRSRIGGVILACLGMAVATFVGATTAAATPWLLPEVVAVWAYATGISVCLGSVASVAVLQWSVALLIAMGLPFDPADAALRACFVVAGGLLQAALVAASWAMRPGVREQSSLAASFAALASDAYRLAEGTSTGLPPNAFAAGPVLDDPNPMMPEGLHRVLVELLEEAERVRAVLAALDAGGHDAAARALLHDAADALDLVARALLASRVERARSIEALTAKVANFKRPADAPWRWSAEMLSDRLRAVALLLKDLDATAWPTRSPQSTTLPPPKRGTLSAALTLLRANIATSTETGRHALRLAIVAGLAEALARSAGLAQARWVVLTLLLVLKPDYGSTITRGLHRAFGTLIGAFVATVIADMGHSAPGWLVVACGVAVTLAYAVFRVNYFLYTIPLTVFILVLLALLGSPPFGTAETRTIDTFVGSAIGVLAYLAWPTWKGATAQHEFATLLRAHGDYTVHLLRELASPGSVQAPRLRNLQAAARRARSDAQTAANRLTNERSRAPFTSELASHLLAAVARLATAELALHALVLAAARADSGRVLASVPIDAVGAVMIEMAESLRRLEAPPASTMRSLQDALAGRGNHDTSAIDVAAARLFDAMQAVFDLLRSGLPS